MPFIKRLQLDVTTAPDGSSTASINTDGGGLLHQLVYVKHGTNPFANTVTFTLTEVGTGRALLTTGAIAASANFMPRDAAVSISNAALLYAAGGTAVADLIPVSGMLQLALANGGDTKQGTFYIYLS